MLQAQLCKDPKEPEDGYVGRPIPATGEAEVGEVERTKCVMKGERINVKLWQMSGWGGQQKYLDAASESLWEWGTMLFTVQCWSKLYFSL